MLFVIIFINDFFNIRSTTVQIHSADAPSSKCYYRKYLGYITWPRNLLQSQ